MPFLRFAALSVHRPMLSSAFLVVLAASPLLGQTKLVRPRVVIVASAHQDSAKIMTGLVVTLSRIEDTSQVVTYAEVTVLKSRNEQPSALNPGYRPDATGTVRLDSVAPGKPVIFVRALGLKSLLVPVTLIAGCITRLQIHLADLQICDEGPCPPMKPPRATMMLCRPDA